MKIQSYFFLAFLCMLSFTCLSKGKNNCIENILYSNNNIQQVYVESKNIRRHFILAIDISGTFVSKLESTPTLKKSLIALFQNKIPSFSVNENSINIRNESNNGISFLIQKMMKSLISNSGLPNLK